MKYLKRFNEELKPWTYTQASRKLRDIGHVNRASRLEEWADKRRKDEEKKALADKITKLEKTPAFRMKFFNDTWNSQKRQSDYGEIPFLEGNFYIEIYFEQDFMWEEIYEYLQDRTSTLQFTFDIGLFPADEQTQKDFDEVTKKDNNDYPYVGDVWRNTIWPVHFTIRLNNDKTLIEQGKSTTFWEGKERVTTLFADRRESMKFKRLLISSFNGGDDYFSKAFSDVKDFFKKVIEKYNEKDIYFYSRTSDRNKGKEGYNSEGVPLGISDDNIKQQDGRKYYWDFGDKECTLKESDYQYFENAVRRMSINNLYRD